MNKSNFTETEKNLKFPDDFLNEIICGDAVSTMKQIPDSSLDLIVTSPPYNLKNSTGNRRGYTSRSIHPKQESTLLDG